MRSKAEVFKDHYGVETLAEVQRIRLDDLDAPCPPLEKWTTMQLPYIAPEHPGIPTMDEIDRGMEESRINQLCGDFPVCRIGDCVVKAGYSAAIIQEAENLLFLQQYPQIRTSKLYAAFQDDREGIPRYYMVSQFMEGGTLSRERYVGLDPDSQKTIAFKIGEQLQLLQSIPSEGYYGRINRQGWDPFLNLLGKRWKDMCGPYDTFDDMLSAMFTAAELREADGVMSPEFLPSQIEFLSQFKSKLSGPSGRRPVLTHLDPTFENIIAKPIQDDEGKILDWEVCFIDWDRFGWFPAFIQNVAIARRTALFPDEGVTEDYLFPIQGVKEGFQQVYEERVFANFPEKHKIQVEFLRETSVYEIF